MKTTSHSPGGGPNTEVSLDCSYGMHSSKMSVQGIFTLCVLMECENVTMPALPMYWLPPPPPGGGVQYVEITARHRINTI